MAGAGSSGGGSSRRRAPGAAAPRAAPPPPAWLLLGHIGMDIGRITPTCPYIKFLLHGCYASCGCLMRPAQASCCSSSIETPPGQPPCLRPPPASTWRREHAPQTGGGRRRHQCMNIINTNQRGSYTVENPVCVSDSDSAEHHTLWIPAPHSCFRSPQVEVHEQRKARQAREHVLLHHALLLLEARGNPAGPINFPRAWRVTGSMRRARRRSRRRQQRTSCAHADPSEQQLWLQNAPRACFSELLKDGWPRVRVRFGSVLLRWMDNT